MSDIIDLNVIRIKKFRAAVEKLVADRDRQLGWSGQRPAIFPDEPVSRFQQDHQKTESEEG